MRVLKSGLLPPFRFADALPPFPARSEVLAVADVPPAQLDVLESRCRAIYFNSRLAVVARPEFLLRGDGLARSFREAEAVTVDHWGQLATVLREVRLLVLPLADSEGSERLANSTSLATAAA